MPEPISASASPIPSSVGYRFTLLPGASQMDRLKARVLPPISWILGERKVMVEVVERDHGRVETRIRDGIKRPWIATMVAILLLPILPILMLIRRYCEKGLSAQLVPWGLPPTKPESYEKCSTGLELFSHTLGKLCQDSQLSSLSSDIVWELVVLELLKESTLLQDKLYWGSQLTARDSDANCLNLHFSILDPNCNPVATKQKLTDDLYGRLRAYLLSGRAERLTKQQLKDLYSSLQKLARAAKESYPDLKIVPGAAGKLMPILLPDQGLRADRFSNGRCESALPEFVAALISSNSEIKNSRECIVELLLSCQIDRSQDRLWLTPSLFLSCTDAPPSHLESEKQGTHYAVPSWFMQFADLAQKPEKERDEKEQNELRQLVKDLRTWLQSQPRSAVAALVQQQFSESVEPASSGKETIIEIENKNDAMEKLLAQRWTKVPDIDLRDANGIANDCFFTAVLQELKQLPAWSPRQGNLENWSHEDYFSVIREMRRRITKGMKKNNLILGEEILENGDKAIFLKSDPLPSCNNDGSYTDNSHYRTVKPNSSFLEMERVRERLQTVYKEAIRNGDLNCGQLEMEQLANLLDVKFNIYNLDINKFKVLTNDNRLEALPSLSIGQGSQTITLRYKRPDGGGVEHYSLYRPKNN